MYSQINVEGAKTRQEARTIDAPVGAMSAGGAALRRNARTSFDWPVHSLTLKPGAQVSTAESAGRSVWFLQSGLLRTQRHSYDGKRQILSLSLPGEIVGYESHLRDGMSVEAVTPCTLCRIDKRDFEAMLKDDQASRGDLMRQQQQQLDRLLWLTWSIAVLRPDERFSTLLVLASRFMPYQAQPDGTGILSMQLPRPDIADLLGTTAETISRIVHRLSETGVIEIIDPAHFRILDMKRLIASTRLGGSFEPYHNGWNIEKNRLNLLFGQGSKSREALCA